MKFRNKWFYLSANWDWTDVEMVVKHDEGTRFAKLWFVSERWEGVIEVG